MYSRLVMPPGPRGPRAVRPPARPALAAAIAVSGRSFINIARAVGVEGSCVARVVSGAIKPSRSLCERIAAVLGVRDVDALFALDPSPEQVAAVVAQVTVQRAEVAS